MASVFGKFLSLEGIDGCGKSTQALLLQEYLQRRGIDTLLTREPGGTQIGVEIRKILQNPEHQELISETELLLYLADRLQHLQQKILPALQQGKWVISDRFHDSTVAYQGGGRGLPLQFLDSLVTSQIQPHLPFRTFVLLLSPELATQRLQLRQHHSGQSASRLDRESLLFFQRVHTAFEELIAANPQRCIPIDAGRSQEEVQRQICQSVDELLFALEGLQ